MCSRFFLVRLKLLAETKIDDLDVTVLVQQDIVRFQIAMEYLVCVKVLKSLQDLHSPDLDLFLFDPLRLDESLHFTTLDHGHGEVQTLLALKEVGHIADVRMIGLEENLAFNHDGIDNMHLIRKHVLADNLDCEWSLYKVFATSFLQAFL